MNYVTIQGSIQSVSESVCYVYITLTSKCHKEIQCLYTRFVFYRADACEI
jgi:hypothetical protein